MSKFDSIWVPTLEGAFLESYEGAIEKTWSYDVVTKIDSPSEFLKLVGIGSVGKVRQFTGSRQTQDAVQYTSIVQNLPYECSMQVDADDYRRDNIGIFAAQAAELGAKFADHVNLLAVNTITANSTCLDGVALFSASHPVNGTTQKNLVTTSEIPSLQTAAGSGLTPTALEASTALLDTVSYLIGRLTDEVGDPINGPAREFTVVTGNPKIWAAMTTAINSPQLNSGQTNPLQGILNSGYKFKCVVDNRLGASTAVFYVFRTDSKLRALVWSEELPFQMSHLGEDSDSYFNDNLLKWGGKSVRAVAPYRYQHAIKATLA